MTELDVLDPAEEHVKLSTGAVLVLESLRTRQFFKLLRNSSPRNMKRLRDSLIHNRELRVVVTKRLHKPIVDTLIDREVG